MEIPKKKVLEFVDGWAVHCDSCGNLMNCNVVNGFQDGHWICTFCQKAKAPQR